jgi:L-ascorbate metabolism protein UlaG (beta-lactamase superfamily)
MRLRLIRHATLHVRMAGHRLVVDPMLDPAGARPPVPDTPNQVPNPLVELPEPPEIVVQGLSALLVTHLHQDHLDATAVALAPKDVPVFCAPGDAGKLREHGFADVRPVEGAVDWEGLRIVITGGVHGPLGPSPGFVVAAEGEPTLYVAGDTIWCEDVRAAIDAHAPDVVVVNASGAHFVDGDPLVMTTDEVLAVARYAPAARIVAVHFEAINHCLETRADLHQRLHEEELTDHVTVPEDGAEVPV